MSELFELSKQKIMAFVDTRDPVRAKAFYAGTLGLRLVSDEAPHALVFDANGITLRVSIVKNLTPTGHTVLGWQVADIVVAVKALTQAGVKFERYQGFEQDELGIWTVPNGAGKVAWFKDPDGNTLSISDH
jgi:catechol 2,3-dioxygenase-like lactoylglutathione lyase family enzyme